MISRCVHHVVITASISVSDLPRSIPTRVVMVVSTLMSLIPNLGFLCALPYSFQC